MRKIIKICLLVALFAAIRPCAWGFALLGPLPTDPGGEPWQIPANGYGLIYWENLYPSPFITSPYGGSVWLGDIGGPHNIGEEYRRVTPTMFYAYDQNFLDFFGLAGTTNCDAAFAIMNAVTNVSSYSQTLIGDFPNYSQSQNPLAQALYLLDLKSVTLHLIVEQMGLAEPERYTWAIHDRDIPTGCPLTTTYLVVQRNFNDYDVPAALNQLAYSAYVNGVLYTYFIFETCRTSQPFPDDMAVAFSTQPLNPEYTSVAANDNEPFGGLQLGGFYTGLTRDDVAGLRYLMNSNNINFEAPASAGGLLIQTNVQAALPLTTLPLSLLFQNPMTNDPATLLATYPGISFLSVQTNIISALATNIVFFYTNLSAPFTNSATNFPGWQPIQYGGFQTNTTLSLSDFIANATNDPAALLAIPGYNNLLITSATTNSLAVQATTNVTPYFTNLFAPFTNVANGFPTNINFQGWSPLQYGALFTNSTLSLADFIAFAATNDPVSLANQYPGLIITSASTNSHVVVVTTNFFNYFTNQFGLPYITNSLVPVGGLMPGYYFTNQPGPTVITYPQTQQLLTNIDLYQFSLDARVLDPTQLVGKYGGLVIISYYSIPTNQTLPNIVTYFTNYVGQGITAPPTLVIATNGFTTTYFNQYYYQFGNLVTNHYYGTAPVTVTTTVITNHVGAGITSPNVTNVTVQTFYTNQPSGDLLIIPTSWCGFQVGSAYPPTPVIGVSNNLGSASATFAVTNTLFYSRTLYYTFTNRVYNITPGICNSVLLLGTNTATNILTTYSFTFANVLTNHFYSNSLIRTYTTNVFFTGGTGTNLTTNTTLVQYYTNRPSGDIFIVPTTWCGYSYVTLLTNLTTFTNVFFTTAASGGPFYSQVTIGFFTNYTLSMKPGFCEPRLAYATNYTTNVAGIYQYSFGNVITNHFYTNNYVQVLATNIFLVNGGPVGSTGTNISVTTNYLGRPGGDIFIVPTNWCGYHYSTLLATLVTTTNTIVANTAPPPSPPVQAAGQSYSQTFFGFETNYLLSIQPGFCEALITSGTNYSTNLVTAFNYVYSGIITNRYNPNTLVTVVTTNLAAVTNGLVGTLTNLVTTNLLNVGVTGDFFIVPPQWCGLKILATNFSTIVFSTNTVFPTNSPAPDVGQRFSQTTVFVYTNTTYTVQPQICSTAPPVPNLRRGIEHVQFTRANYDSLIGQTFRPITNYYTMTVISNSQQITEYYQRVVTQPDFRLTARDLAAGPTTANNAFNGTVERGITFDSSQILQGLRGPGTIRGASTFTYNKVGTIFRNLGFNDTNSFILFSTAQETNHFPLLQWASYDISTNIVLYPNSVSIANLANAIFIQMSPATVPDGTNGVAYPTQTFTASGGQPPYTWSAPNLSSVFPGMSFNPLTQQLSGTPGAGGTFNFIIELTDSVNRTVDYNYTVTIY